MFLVLLLLALSLARGFRLPPALAPRHYDLALAFNLDPAQDFPYFGLVKIHLTAVRPTDKIALHAVSPSYNVSDDNVTVSDSRSSLKIQRVTRTDKTGLLTVKLPRALQENETVTLAVPFSGYLNKGLRGIFISSYEDVTSQKTEYLVSTQFEPTHARRGFPCLDEPQLKASFRVSIAHHANYSALANMPLEANFQDNPKMEDYWPWDIMNEKFKSKRAEFKWSQFAVSPPMSSYLVAFVVSRFARQQSSPAAAGRVPCAVWTRRDALGQSELAVDICPKILSVYENWFEVPYPLPKLDLVAIPDFSIGGMENWGLVTFKESLLLYDNNISTLMDKKSTVDIMAHELAHQWFGDLVTMEWWSDLWLKEGLATFMSRLLKRELLPTWTTDTDIIMDMISTLEFDATRNSYPVSMFINNPDEISFQFDSISNLKASLLIRMSSIIIKMDVFQKGLQLYLKKYAYKSASAYNLWQALASVARAHQSLSTEISFEKVMVSWTTQTGYPLLNVTRNYDDFSFTITQTQYLTDASSSRQAFFWWVPILLRSEASNRAAPVAWLKANEGTNTPHKFDHAASPDQWLILNDKMMVPCRVNYDAANWRLLGAALRRAAPRALPALSRAQLLVDAFELAARGDLDYAVPIDLASYLPQETDLAPLKAALVALQYIYDKLKRSPDLEVFHKYMRMIITPLYNGVGGLTGDVGDNMMKAEIQIEVVWWACVVEVPGCEDTAVDLFKTWMESENPDEENPIPPGLRGTVCCAGVRRGGLEQFRFMMERLRRAAPGPASDYRAALACSRDQWLLKLYLDMALQAIDIRPQDVPEVTRFVVRSAEGFTLAREFLYTKIQAVYDRFGPTTGSKLVMELIGNMVHQFTEQEEIDTFIEWLKQHAKKLVVIKAAVDRSVEEARRGVGWARHRPRLLQLLREQTEWWQEDHLPMRRFDGSPRSRIDKGRGRRGGRGGGGSDGRRGGSGGLSESGNCSWCFWRRWSPNHNAAAPHLTITPALFGASALLVLWF